MLLDALGTLLTLAPPGPALARGLAREHGIELAVPDAERAFGAEIAYYRAHHHRARDRAGLAALRRRCAAVLHGALPREAAAAIGAGELLAPMLAALRFSAYPDAAPALAALRARGLRLVVVSNWDPSLGEVLETNGLAELLDGVLTSAEVGRPKPGAEIFQAALALAGVPAEAALHVGDSYEHDVAGARGAGIAAVLLRRNAEGGGAAGESPPAGVPVIGSLSELPALLRGPGGGERR